MPEAPPAILLPNPWDEYTKSKPRLFTDMPRKAHFNRCDFKELSLWGYKNVTRLVVSESHNPECSSLLCLIVLCDLWWELFKTKELSKLIKIRLVHLSSLSFISIQETLINPKPQMGVRPVSLLELLDALAKSRTCYTVAQLSGRLRTALGFLSWVPLNLDQPRVSVKRHNQQMAIYRNCTVLSLVSLVEWSCMVR